MNLKIPVLFNAVLFFVLAVKASEKKNMKAGEKITLLTGFTELHGEYSVLLYLKNGIQKDNLIKCDGENVECELSKTFEGKLDGESGSLTFGPLNVKDSGVYVIETTNGDSDVLEKYYEVTVSDDPNPVTAKRPENSNDPNNPRSQIGLCVALPIVCAIGLLLGTSFLIFKKKTQTEKKGN
ncbi:uncharacterized protein zgc:171500 isoform X2 [Labrus mixtus]|nr:uncharacterized protein zgc:171500 isoform X2 [Labrus mixtus]